LEEMEKYFEAKEKIEKEMQEKALSQDMTLEEIRNLARSSNMNNADDASDKQQSAKEIQEKYEEELRKEMYGDKYEDVKAELDKEISRDEFSEYRQTPESLDKEGDADYYTGPSLVKVELENKKLRHHYIDIPVFTCRGSGVVVVGITVDSFGNVVNADIINAPGHSGSNCLIQAAKQAAMNSRFASSENGTTGTITYHFIPQE
ncbi:MAG: energy transducer TonB, partial [Bacteroidales bacterium]